MNKKKSEEILNEMDEILKLLDNFSNADSDYSKLNEKLKSGTITDDEKKILIKGFEELPYWTDKIENSVKKVMSITKDLDDSENESI